MRMTSLFTLIAGAALLSACGGSDTSATPASVGSASNSGNPGGSSQVTSGGTSQGGAPAGPPQGSATPGLTITSRSPPGGRDYLRYSPQNVASCKPGNLYCRCYPGGYLGRTYCIEYGFQLTAGGGTPPYSWKWTATSASGLPPGLSLSAAAVIGGAPTKAGAYPIQIAVTDSSNPALQTTADYTITITPPPLAQFQTVSTLAAGVNVPFSMTFSDSGGQPPLTWSEAGALPSGFSVSSTGVLSGTPLVTGTFPVTVYVQDSAGQGSSQPLTIIITPHGFAMTGGMVTARSQHAATLLKDGTVLISGGNYNGNPVADSELYGAADGAFSATGALATARYSHTATLLGTGQVLVAGGDDVNGLAIASAELYDPGTKTFTPLGNMVSARDSYTATLLGNGKVLLAGGSTQATYGTIVFIEATAELFDPVTGSFSATGTMTVPRAGHTATMLPTGKVLIAGGDTANGSTASAELYDPSTGMFTPTGSMNDVRYAHTATLLANGTVLITGGISAAPTQAVNQMLTTAEIYHPNTGSFTTTGGMTAQRSFHTAVRLGDGSVLVAGGIDQNANPLLSAEVYAPGAGQFSLTGGLQIPRQEHTATLLGNGAVLVTGGNNASPTGLTVVPAGATIGAISTAEMYR